MSDATPTQEANLIECAACGAQHPLVEMAMEEEVRPALVQVSLVCPSCGDKKHACFDTPDLRAQRETARAALATWQAKRTPANWEQYRTAQSKYRREFDAVNKRWRRKFGIVKTVVQREADDGAGNETL